MLKRDTKKLDNFDVAVIGAGPAGIMSACAATCQGLSVVLIEKNAVPGKKLLLTGNGRCNLTNAEFNLRELVKNYNGGEFLFHAFSVFGPKEVVSFFEELGVKTKIEKNKRVFPTNADAQEVLGALERYLEKNKVNVHFNSEIVDVKKSGKKITRLVLKSGEIVAKKYILCTGGKSYPSTGSDGFGYKLAEEMGHTIVKPSPALAPIAVKNEWAKKLQGISLENVKLSLFCNGKKCFAEQGEILFTHFGLSGPAVLNISGRVGELLGTGSLKLSLDLFPMLNQDELLKNMEEILKRYGKSFIKNMLSDILPERLSEVLLDIIGIDRNKIANNISKIERTKIVKILKNLEITVDDVLGFDQAMVTRGGVSLKEIDHKTMKSKIINNLFFAGEIINVDGKTGGFNLQMCWSTGHLAGQNKTTS
jgi:predicted Rossmann fold flavoprotein